MESSTSIMRLRRSTALADARSHHSRAAIVRVSGGAPIARVGSIGGRAAVLAVVLGPIVLMSAALGWVIGRSLAWTIVGAVGAPVVLLIFAEAETSTPQPQAGGS